MASARDRKCPLLVKAGIEKGISSEFFNSLGYKRLFGPCSRYDRFAPDSRHASVDVCFFADYVRSTATSRRA
jgi:hypothetical protein